MTQFIERTMKKVLMLGKVVTVLKDCPRIQNSLDVLNKDS